MRFYPYPPGSVDVRRTPAVSSRRERTRAGAGLLDCDVRRTSRVLHAPHIPKQWRVEFEDALDVLSKGRRHRPFSPRDVRHLVEGNLLDLIGDLLALRLIGRAHPVGHELLDLRRANVHARVQVRVADRIYDFDGIEPAVQDLP